MESALLFQTGYFREMDVMLVTEAGVNMRAERLVKRDRIAHAEAIARIQSQEFNIPDKVKIPVYYIRNNNNHEMLLSQVVQFHELMIL
jgi:dephospho-CoA kinase